MSHFRCHISNVGCRMSAPSGSCEVCTLIIVKGSIQPGIVLDSSRCAATIARVCQIWADMLEKKTYRASLEVIRADSRIHGCHGVVSVCLSLCSSQPQYALVVTLSALCCLVAAFCLLPALGSRNIAFNILNNCPQSYAALKAYPVWEACSAHVSNGILANANANDTQARIRYHARAHAWTHSCLFINTPILWCFAIDLFSCHGQWHVQFPKHNRCCLASLMTSCFSGSIDCCCA